MFCGYFLTHCFYGYYFFEKSFFNFNKKILNTKLQQITEVCLEGLVEDRSKLVINPTG